MTEEQLTRAYGMDPSAITPTLAEPSTAAGVPAVCGSDKVSTNVPLVLSDEDRETIGKARATGLFDLLVIAYHRGRAAGLQGREALAQTTAIDLSRHIGTRTFAQATADMREAGR